MCVCVFMCARESNIEKERVTECVREIKKRKKERTEIRESEKQRATLSPKNYLLTMVILYKDILYV